MYGDAVNIQYLSIKLRTLNLAPSKWNILIVDADMILILSRVPPWSRYIAFAKAKLNLNPSSYLRFRKYEYYNADRILRRKACFQYSICLD